MRREFPPMTSSRPCSDVWLPTCLLITLGVVFANPDSIAEEFRRVPLQSKVDEVQPLTGIVLWSDNHAANHAPIQLEFVCLSYKQIVSAQGEYDWSPLENVLEGVADRRHQLVLRWYDTYVGKPTGVPESITKLPGYQVTRGTSEGKPTEFPDWSQPELRRFILEFFDRYSEKYDQDPRIAYLQVGFGLWSEYHLYDGPMKMGVTFPSLEFQTEFVQHLHKTLRQTRWMISVDAAGDWGPFSGNVDLLALPFGVFDDSFNHAAHAKQNEPNWNTLRRDRWKVAPTGGEFSFFSNKDQSQALAPSGPHGTSFENQAADFHISFILGDAQPRFQKAARIRSAGMGCGYRFRVTRFEASGQAARVEIENVGIAPIYYDAFPAIDGVRSQKSLKGLLPQQRAVFDVAAGGSAPQLTIQCDRLVAGQAIGFDADLR